MMQSSASDDVIAYVIKANILTQKAFQEMSSGNPVLLQSAQNSFMVQ